MSKTHDAARRNRYRESKEKRARRPKWEIDGQTVRGLLPEEIVIFFARVERARALKLAECRAQNLRPRAVSPSPACAPAFR
jgi:hypothetical protein